MHHRWMLSLIVLSSIDKYYMLVRRFVNASFRLLVREKWDRPIVADYNDILMGKGGPLW